MAETLDLSARTKQLATLLAPWQTYEIAHSERAPFRASQIGRSVDDVIFFLDGRPGDLAEWLSGRLIACATNPRADAPGTLIITCRLSAEVRRRLATRWLRLQMWLRFQPLTGEATDLKTTVRLPRETAHWSVPQPGTGANAQQDGLKAEGRSHGEPDCGLSAT